MNIVGMFCWVFYHVFGVFIHAFWLGIYTMSWSIDSCLWFLLLYSWFIDSLNSLPGSWFVFIVEMNTLLGCFGLRLEYEYVVVDFLVSFGGCGVN